MLLAQDIFLSRHLNNSKSQTLQHELALQVLELQMHNYPLKNANSPIRNAESSQLNFLNRPEPPNSCAVSEFPPRENQPPVIPEFQEVTSESTRKDGGLLQAISNLKLKIQKCKQVASCSLPHERKIFITVATWDEEILSLRENALKAVTGLYELSEGDGGVVNIAEDLVQSATDCHLRSQKKSKAAKKLCNLCKASKELQKYECKIFSMEGRREDEDKDISTKGSWKMTFEEVILKVLHSLGKAKGADANCLKDAETQMAILETMKKEFKVIFTRIFSLTDFYCNYIISFFKEIRKLWTFIDQQICARDEVDMCKIRLRLKESKGDNPKEKSKVESVLKHLQTNTENRYETIHMLNEHEVSFLTTQSL